MSRSTHLIRFLGATAIVAGILSCADEQPVAPEAGHSASAAQVGVTAAPTSLVIRAQGPLGTSSEVQLSVKRGCQADVCAAITQANNLLALVGGGALTLTGCPQPR